MKKTKKALSFILGAVMSVSACAALVACNPTEQPPVSDVQLNFVATDGSTWDKDVTFDSKKFKLSLDLNKDKTLSLKGTCGGKVASSGGGQGGPGGPGGPAPAAETTPAAEEEDTTDYSQYNFNIAGTWTEEAGWGYTLKLNDGNNTEIVANYDKTSGRHYFYYYMTPKIGETTAKETQVKFEAKDSGYRKTLNANYVVHEERVCEYKFIGSSGLQTTELYLLPNGKVAMFSGKSNSISYTNKGAWTEDKTNHVISGDVNGTKFTTDYCDIAGRKGYRAKISSTSVYSSEDNYDWDKYVKGDFEGTVVETWTADPTTEDGKFAGYKLELTNKGFAWLTDANGSSVKDTKYTVADGVYTIETFTSETAAGVTTITIKWSERVMWYTNEYNITFIKPAA